MKKETKKIMFTGGGTGGHMFPLISVARELRTLAKAEDLNLEFIFIGPRMRGEIFSSEGFVAKHLITGKLRRYMSYKMVGDGLKTIVGFFQAFYYLIKYRPDLIFSKGGYGSFPTVVLAWLLRIPVISHESDSIAGAANRLLSIFSEKIIVSFPGDYPELSIEKTVQLGNPVRDMRGGDPEQARKHFGFASDIPVIFVVGGSQGSTQINSLIEKIIPEITKSYAILHQTGNNEIKDVNIENYRTVKFLNESEMKNAYALADLIVSRAGSGSVFEIALVGKPSILIPLKYDPNKHQAQNAKEYMKKGACIYLDPNEVTPRSLLENINALMNNQKEREIMQKAALDFAKPSAAKDIAKLLLTHIKHE